MCSKRHDKVPQVEGFGSVRWEGLHVHNWIAVVAHREEPQQSAGPFGFALPTISFSGQPLKILAMSYPFLSVTDGRVRYALDVREWGVRKLSDSYVKKMAGRFSSQHDGQMGLCEVDSSFGSSKKVMENPIGRCPLCGEKLHDKQRAGEGFWFKACGNCGFEGGMPGIELM